MKNSIYVLLLSVAMTGVASAASKSAPTRSADLPSFGFVQEMAGITADGDLKVDIYGATLLATDIRFGAFGGELLPDTATATSNATGLGYKHPISPNMAAYGKLYLDTTTGSPDTNITLGFSFTGKADDLLYNANAEIFNCSACGAGASSVSNVNLRAGGFFNVKSKSASGKFSVGGEIDLRMSPSPSQTNIYLGARWLPKTNVMLDVGFLQNIVNTSTVATPAFVRLNLGF